MPRKSPHSTASTPATELAEKLGDLADILSRAKGRDELYLLLEGLLICATAVVAGLVLGFLICFLQQQFGIIGMGDGNFVVPTFPVTMRGIDFLITFFLVMAISSLSVGLTVRKLKIEN